SGQTIPINNEKREEGIVSSVNADGTTNFEFR
ncbi:MAG: hypothetical protein RLZZ479_899, partial [Bacteroidota bacterium]